MNSTRNTEEPLFIGRILSGIGGSTHSTINAVVADISNSDNKTRNFGLLGVSLGIGFIIGPALGGMLGSVATRLPFYFAALLAAINFVIAFFFLEESLPAHKRSTSLRLSPSVLSFGESLSQNRGLRMLLLIVLLSALAQQAYLAMWSFYLMEKLEWNSLDVGFSLGVVGLLMILIVA